MGQIDEVPESLNHKTSHSFWCCDKNKLQQQKNGMALISSF